METKLTVIVDNIPKDELLQGEWGLSILIEYGELKILLDTGKSELFAENLKTLGFDIKDIDYGVLSHAHYDHANGIPKFMQENSKAKFYLRKAVDANCYHLKLFGARYNGIPKDLLTDYANRIEFLEGDYELCNGVYLIPHKTKGLSWIGRREMMYRKTAHGWKADDFSHEQSLVLDTDKGLVILNSCSHGGVLNIINEVKSTFPNQKVYGYIGGMHLFNKSERHVRKVAKELKESEVEYICTGHCTKNRAFEILKEELGDRVQQMRVGLEIKI
ncbi:MBL fold metallo-hydrolase [Pseudobutyrivibrio xylanivorans]|uniref:MBL fold metallo-hydrolase n=1 Tax=Pseudobutyrivibrio xylanivorans TaxID=185007 RepID=A0A5P6VUH1_PSEXY|nr:MBL fold metallo-hydrolase [Pseudobutyrivibrio xylanivorans]QFJ54884.1 MBL fold metallo-hydrolase [Pseudobutyrivibrio xylanivorans]